MTLSFGYAREPKQFHNCHHVHFIHIACSEYPRPYINAIVDCIDALSIIDRLMCVCVRANVFLSNGQIIVFIKQQIDKLTIN